MTQLECGQHHSWVLSPGLCEREESQLNSKRAYGYSFSQSKAQSHPTLQKHTKYPISPGRKEARWDPAVVLGDLVIFKVPGASDRVE